MVVDPHPVSDNSYCIETSGIKTVYQVDSHIRLGPMAMPPSRTGLARACAVEASAVLRRSLRRISTEPRRIVSEAAKAENMLAHFERKVAERHTCASCWQRLAHCICPQLASLATRTERVEVIVSQHYKEWGRSSNTARLISQVLPHSSKILVHPLQDEELDRTLRARPSVLLYPSASSVPCDTISHASPSHPVVCDALDDGAPARPAIPLLLLVLDGTWGTVKALARRVLRQHPKLQHVNVSAVIQARGGLAALHPRKETRSDGACTAEATALALEALGERCAARPLLRGLEVLTESVAQRQGGTWVRKLDKRQRQGFRHLD